jgi:Domain of unknown function (DUF3291)
VTDLHLAELNIGRLNAPMDAPETAEFKDNLDRINALAEAAPGFVWRLQTDEGNATSIKAFDDDLTILNLSVWTSVEALADYVYRTAHTPFLRRRREWFEKADAPIVVLWWVPAGHEPTVAEALERLDHLRANGATSYAFTFRERFAPADGGQLAPADTDDRDACPA